MCGLIPFFFGGGEPAFGPCRQACSAPHKSGARRVNPAPTTHTWHHHHHHHHTCRSHMTKTAFISCTTLLRFSTMPEMPTRTSTGGSKRHSLQAVELSQRTQAAVQIVSNLSAPSNGGPIYRFWACRPCGPAGWLALLLTTAGDVETNPGLNKKVWICDICHKQIHVRKQISIRCNMIEHWVHLRCAGIRQAQYTDTWTCHLHR